MDERALLATLADGATHSGATLAATLGVSRAAVWKQIENLRAAGLPIAAQGGRGYHLQCPLQLLDGDALRAALPRGVGKAWPCIEIHWQLDSTSSELQRRAALLPSGSAIFAERQSAGRGRRGRSWLAPPALGLTFSLLWRFEHGFAALAGLSLAVGVAVAETLHARGAHAITLKWPNDVQHDGGKLAGILVELGGEFLGPCHALIGIGLNVCMPAAVRADAGQPVADLVDACGGVAPARNALAAALLAALAEVLALFAREGFAAFAARYAALDALAGRELSVQTGSETFRASAQGVDARGALRVLRGAQTLLLDSAEVSVRA
ncbi:MAG: biotin--[acetyl-CoA-carboxylase] ligase [Metallibacterium sp.]